jgi:hypothetical protein
MNTLHKKRDPAPRPVVKPRMDTNKKQKEFFFLAKAQSSRREEKKILFLTGLQDFLKRSTGKKYDVFDDG